MGTPSESSISRGRGGIICVALTHIVLLLRYRSAIQLTTRITMTRIPDSTRITDKTLFVFLIDGPKQNAGSLLTPVSDTAFHALSHGTFGFAFHGSFNNHLFQRI